MRDPVPLTAARDPVELRAVRDLLSQAGVVHSLRAPFGEIESLMGGVSAPATVYVDRADLERARAVLADAWGPLDEAGRPRAAGTDPDAP
jgi:predicted ATPase